MKKFSKRTPRINNLIWPQMSRLINQQRDFAEVEKLFRTLKTGDVTETKDEDGNWLITQNNLEGRTYDVLGSLDDWCKFYELLAKPHLPDYNDKPLRKLISKLRLEQIVSMDLVIAAESVVNIQRKLFMSVPRPFFNETWATVYKALEVEAA